ncbi:phage GP46 family protein [Pseudomonas aeruginosa]|nr:phage GP46 family protein [Pseudomonas aeruginosa]
MDAALDPTTQDLTGQRTDTLANAVYLRLGIPLGSWWADPSLGSRLHELARSKDRPRVGVLAQQYAEDALATLTAEGRAQSITVSREQRDDGRLLLHIEVLEAGGRLTTFSTPCESAQCRSLSRATTRSATPSCATSATNCPMPPSAATATTSSARLE